MFTNKSTPPPSAPVSATAVAPVDHPFSDRMRPLHEWEICPLSNGKICSLPRENFFSHQRKNSRCPARWALPRHRPPAPCKDTLQSHATPPHMREEEQCEKSQQATLPPPSPHADDDTIKTRLTCMHKRLAPTMTPMTMTPMTMGFLYIQRASAGDLYKTQRVFRWRFIQNKKRLPCVETSLLSGWGTRTTKR